MDKTWLVTKLDQAWDLEVSIGLLECFRDAGDQDAVLNDLNAVARDARQPPLRRLTASSVLREALACNISDLQKEELAATAAILQEDDWTRRTGLWLQQALGTKRQGGPD